MTRAELFRLAWGIDTAHESSFGQSGFAGESAFARRIETVTTPTPQACADASRG